MQPKVTIVTITYNLLEANREKTFRQCVESVHNQTYENIEHIVIDGASNDGTIELLKEYADKNWLTYYSEPDTSIYNAMNKGLAKATGEYITFLNSDDFYHNLEGISKTVKTIVNSNADFVYSDFIAAGRDYALTCQGERISWSRFLCDDLLLVADCLALAYGSTTIVNLIRQ